MVRVLGSIEVEVDSAPVVLASPSERRIVAAFVTGGGIAGRDRLIDALWGDDPPPSALRSLQTYISRLRHSLGSHRIETRPPGWVLHADLVDVRDFERLVAEARALPAAQSVAAFDEALAWWRGAAYEEFAVERFARGEARRLEELRLAARVDRADALLMADAVADSVAALEALVTEEPLHEPAWELLVRGLAAAGRNAEALRAAHRCREELAAVGLEATPALAREEAAALTHGEVSPHHPSLPGGIRLPIGVGDFVARNAEVAHIETLVADGRRCVTLLGPGGVGKTRLAVEAARALSDRFAGAVFLRPGRDRTTRVGPRRHGRCSRRATDHTARGPPRRLLCATSTATPARQLRTRHRRHEPDGEPAPRRRARAGDYHDDPRAPPHPARAHRGLGAAGTAGRRTPLPAAPPLLGRPADDPDAITELCCRLDNLPLAIEIAAGWSRSLTATQLAARARRRRSATGAGRPRRAFPTPHARRRDRLVLTSWRRTSAGSSNDCQSWPGRSTSTPPPSSPRRTRPVTQRVAA